MDKKFVCLANSRRKNGRCIAGLLLDVSNQPSSTWIRPIKKINSSIPQSEVQDIGILSVVKIVNFQKVNSTCSW